MSDALGAPKWERLEKALDYAFRDSAILGNALRHASYSHEHAELESNERLEFLGDAVIGLVVARLLYEAHPDWSEGDLTRALSSLVDCRSLAGLGSQLGLGEQLQLGRTERSADGASNDTILADATEAVLGAMYLDGGLEPVERLARRRFVEALSPDAVRVPRDAKTDFQERVMALYREFPRYEVAADTGVEGGEERFTVRVMVRGDCWGEGIGRSKQRAEKRAAEAALSRAVREQAATRRDGP